MIQASARTVIGLLLAVPRRSRASASSPENSAMVARRTASSSAARSLRVRVRPPEREGAVAEHALGVHHVADHLFDAPLPRRVAVQGLGLGQAGEQLLGLAPLVFEERQEV